MSPVQSNIVRNGSFEALTFEYPNYWTGVFGVNTGIAADGVTSAAVDFAGEFVAQTLGTVAGQTYHVSFAVSGNSSSPGLSIVQLGWGGSTVGDVTWESPYTPGDGRNFNWQYGNFDLVAASSSTLLRFERSPVSTSAGTWLDDVRVLQIPEPSFLALSVLSLFAVLVRWTRPSRGNPARHASARV